MTLEEMVKLYRHCPVEPESEGCVMCPMRNPILEHDEHPTYCEMFAALDNSLYPICLS